MEIKENQIYQNKENGKYVHIKEITHWCDEDGNIANIVCSDDCNHKSDSKTNVIRKVYTLSQFIGNYEEIPKYKAGDYVLLKNDISDKGCYVSSKMIELAGTIIRIDALEPAGNSHSFSSRDNCDVWYYLFNMIERKATQEEIDDLTKTYSVGDFIEIKLFTGSEIFILARIDIDIINAISLNDGNRYTTAIKVKDTCKITKKEMNSLIGCHKFKVLNKISLF